MKLLRTYDKLLILRFRWCALTVVCTCAFTVIH